MGEHKIEDLTGKAKEAVGDLTDDEGLKREGKIDQASATTKKLIDEAADKVKDAVNPKPDKE
jgi:uncharacterized protein YjbJ (UPF0337 family)